MPGFYEAIQNKALRTGPAMGSELKHCLLTLIFNLVKINSAYSAIVEEGSHNQDVAVERKIK